MRIDIYGDGVSYVTDEVSSIAINEANTSEENRYKFVTDLAAVSRGKSEANNPKGRFFKLLEEAAPTDEEVEITDFQSGEKPSGSPSRPLEFLPVVLVVVGMCNEAGVNRTTDLSVVVKLKGGEEQYFNLNDFTKYFGGVFGYIRQGKLYTNMRAVLNAGIPYDLVPYNSKEELKEFRALKAKIPMFVWGQVPNTHIALSKEAQSDRVVTVAEYWLPADFRDKVYAFDDKHALLGFANREDMVHSMLNDYSQNEIQAFFKAIGYHKEVYSRAMYYFKYKEVVFTGWKNHPYTFDHLFLERNAKREIWKNWTQSQTETFVLAIKEIVEQ